MASYAPSGAAVQTFQPQTTMGTVLCCLCGTNIPPNPSNMCVNCIRSQVDISEGIQKQVTVLWCKDCGRYLQPPKHWVRAEHESKELLTFCIKKIKGLSKASASAARSGSPRACMQVSCAWAACSHGMLFMPFVYA